MNNLKKECETKSSFRKLEDIDLQIAHAPGYDESFEGEAVMEDTEYGKSNNKLRIGRRKHLGTSSKPGSSRSI